MKEFWFCVIILFVYDCNKNETTADRQKKNKKQQSCLRNWQMATADTLVKVKIIRV